jgi:hypothetical protein
MPPIILRSRDSEPAVEGFSDPSFRASTAGLIMGTHPRTALQGADLPAFQPESRSIPPTWESRCRSIPFQAVGATGHRDPCSSTFANDRCLFAGGAVSITVELAGVPRVAGVDRCCPCGANRVAVFVVHRSGGRGGRWFRRWCRGGYRLRCRRRGGSRCRRWRGGEPRCDCRLVRTSAQDPGYGVMFRLGDPQPVRGLD